MTHTMYHIGLDQTANLIKAVGSKRTVLVQGHMGTGKSSLLKMLADQLPTHRPVYFDCTTKDLGDLMLPRIADVDAGTPYVSYAPNEELGIHHNEPVIVDLDEYGKANPAVKQGLTAFMLERRLGNNLLHPDSIVYATTNLGAEGVGDLLVAHQRNRIIPVTLRKPSNVEWIEWGINNDIDHSLLGWCRDNPQLFADFTEIKDPDENPYVFHPRAADRTAFVTPRSLETASDLLKTREFLDDQSVVAGLIGAIGERAAMDLMAFVKLADQLPSLQSIKDDPHNATVPSSAAAVCMVVYRTMTALDKDWLNAWMDYMLRLPKEAQGMFANGVRAPKYSKQQMVMTNKKFTEWAMQNNYLFAADVK